MSHFTAGQHNVFLYGWQPGVPTPGQEALSYENIVGRAHDLWQNNPIARAAINRLIDNVIGTGVRLQAQPEKKMLGLTPDQAMKWTADVEARFRLWWESTDVDLEGTRTGADMCRLVLTNILVHGDSGVRFVRKNGCKGKNNLKLQVIDGTRFRTPISELRNENIISGVEVDPATNGPKAYYIDVTRPNPVTGAKIQEPKKYDRIENGRIATDLIFIPQRPSQYRGLSIFVPVMQQLKMLMDLLDAGIRAEQNRSGVAFAITTKQPELDVKELDGSLDAAKDREPIPTPEEYYGKKDQSIAIGKVIRLNEGDEFVVIPNMNTAQVLKELSDLLCLVIGAAIGIPMSTLLIKYGSSYSASRGERLDFERVDAFLFKFLTSRLCSYVYEYWLEADIALGNTEAPGFFLAPETRAAWLAHEWSGDASGHIDPTKIVNFYKEAVAAGFCSRERAINDLFGSDFTTEMGRIAQERNDMEKAGLSDLVQTLGMKEQKEQGDGGKDKAKDKDNGDDKDDGKGGDDE